MGYKLWCPAKEGRRGTEGHHASPPWPYTVARPSTYRSCICICICICICHDDDGATMENTLAQ